jgi:hypothetical protein
MVSAALSAAVPGVLPVAVPAARPAALSIALPVALSVARRIAGWIALSVAQPILHPIAGPGINPDLRRILALPSTCFDADGPGADARLTSDGHRLRCCVAKQKHTPTRKNRVRNQILQWGIVGVVGAVILFLSISALTRPPVEPAPPPFLSNAQEDVIGLTRMLGDVVMDSSIRAKFPAGLEPKLKGADTLIEQRRWYDALNALQKLLGKATPAESVAINAYMAVGFTKAASEDRAVVSFRKVLAKDPTPTGLGPWAAFNIGFLFQSRGYPDSAAAYYARARDMLSGSTGFLRVASLNNLGAALENLKDADGAVAAYSEAAAYVDTLTGQRDLKTIIENRARVVRTLPAPRKP